MTESIKNIFEQNIRLLGEMDRAIVYFREQQYEKGLSIVVHSIDQMKYSLDSIINDREYFNLVSTDSVFEMLSGIIEAQKNKDNILLADLLELQLVSFLCGVQELIISKEEMLFDEEKYQGNINLLLEKAVGFEELGKEPLKPSELLEKGYRVEFTSCGLMTLAAENDGSTFYFHTNNRIQMDALLLAKHWYTEGKKRYLIYGYGMGYHLQELLDLINSPDVVIEVFEGDRNVMQLACAFTDLNLLRNHDNIKLYYDPQFQLLSERVRNLSSEEVFNIHYPSYKNIKDEFGRAFIENYIPWSKTLEYC